MWKSWIPEGLLPRKHTKKNSNLQQRIFSLYESTKSVSRDCSPVLSELQNQKNKVRRLSSVYEENIAAFNDPNTSFVFRKPSAKEHTPAKLDATLVPSELFDSPKVNELVNRFVSYQPYLKAPKKPFNQSKFGLNYESPKAHDSLNQNNGALSSPTTHITSQKEVSGPTKLYAMLMSPKDSPTSSNNFTIRKPSNKEAKEAAMVSRLDDILKSPKANNSPKSSLSERVMERDLMKKQSSARINSLVKKLIDWDSDFIKIMELLIEKYVNEFDKIPALRLKDEISITSRQKVEIFGQIELIRDFHKDIFHPLLVACEEDTFKLANIISSLCNEGSFNVYLVYAMDEKDCEYRRNVYYKSFIEQITDKVGFPYYFTPIQQLDRYHFVIADILKELQKWHASEDKIVAMEIAEYDWRTLMTKLNTMRNL